MSINVDQDKIELAIAEEVASRLIGEENLSFKVSKMLEERVDNFFADKAETRLEQIITAAIDGGFDREYQPTDGFGRAKGSKTSIRERLEETTKSYWAQWVDKNGKPTESQYHHMTRAEWVMLQACGKDFAESLKQEAINVTGTLKDSLRAELKGWVDKTLNELFHVKSNDDRKK